MMTKHLSQEIIQKIHKLVLYGKSKYSIAKQMGVGISTVYKHTKDIPSGKWHRKFSKEIIQQIRLGVINGKSKY